VSFPGVTSARNDASLERLLSVLEVADLLAVPASWIYRRLRGHAPDRLPGLRLGKYWRFREADVRSWVEKRPRA
jgi:excisionase family DNA binding protein